MERTLRERQIEQITWLMVDGIENIGMTYPAAEALNENGWTVEVSNGRDDGWWLRCEGMELTETELGKAWGNALAFVEA